MCHLPESVTRPVIFPFIIIAFLYNIRALSDVGEVFQLDCNKLLAARSGLWK